MRAPKNRKRRDVALIVASREDRLARRIARALRRLGRQVVALDPRDLAGAARITWRPGDLASSALRVGSAAVALDRLGAVHVGRIFDYRGERTPRADRLYVGSEVHALLRALFDELSDSGCLVRNRIDPSIDSRPLVTSRRALDALARSGFSRPRMVITSDAREAERFVEASPGPMLVGSALRAIDAASEPGARARSRITAAVRREPRVLQSIPRGARGAVVHAFQCGPRTIVSGAVADRASLSRAGARLASALGIDGFRLLVSRDERGRWTCHGIDPHPTAEDLGPRVEAEAAAAIAALLARRVAKASR